MYVHQATDLSFEGGLELRLVNNKSLANMATTMSQIYDQERDMDGFLYMVYASHEFFIWTVIIISIVGWF